MRMIIAAVVAMTTSVAMAEDIADAHRLAVAGRDAYWNCLAREYTRDGNRNLSGQDFTSLVASACSSERQNFRVALVDYLSMQFRGADVGDPMTTANNAIALAQKDIVTAFIAHKQPPK
jgi:ABC-type phosphate transport system auxiliary subunit